MTRTRRGTRRRRPPLHRCSQRRRHGRASRGERRTQRRRFRARGFLRRRCEGRGIFGCMRRGRSIRRRRQARRRRRRRERRGGGRAGRGRNRRPFAAHIHGGLVYRFARSSLRPEGRGIAFTRDRIFTRSPLRAEFPLFGRTRPLPLQTFRGGHAIAGVVPPDFFRYVVVDRAGVRFLLADSQFGQNFEDLVRGNLELPRQLVNADFLHSFRLHHPRRTRLSPRPPSLLSYQIHSPQPSKSRAERSPTPTAPPTDAQRRHP